jgi:ferredoxin
MKAIVDRDACTGCGLCPETCPEVFELDDEGLAKVKADPVPADAEDSAREAADGCPVEAITLQE